MLDYEVRLINKQLVMLNQVKFDYVLKNKVKLNVVIR